MEFSQEAWTAILLSLRIAAVATLASLPLAVAVAMLLARGRFPGKVLLDGRDTQALVPVGTAGATLTFGNGSDMRVIQFDGTIPGFVIGTQVIGFDPVQLTAA